MTNTGYQQATIAYCVSRPGDLPLDINGDLCSLSGKKQAIMLLKGEENPNPAKYEVYKTFEAGQLIDGIDTRIYNPEVCPIVTQEDFSVNKSPLLYGVSDGNGFDIKDTVEVTSSVGNLYRDYQVSSKPAWLTATIGTTNGQVNMLNLVVQRNRTDDDKRESVLILTQNGTGKKITIPVVQSGRLTDGIPTEYPYVNEEEVLDKESKVVQLGEQIWSRELFTEVGLDPTEDIPMKPTFGSRIDQARGYDSWNVNTKIEIGDARLETWYNAYNASKNFFPSGVIPTADEFHSIAGMRYNKPGIDSVRGGIYELYGESTDDSDRDVHKHHLPLDSDYVEFGGFLAAHNWNGEDDITQTNPSQFTTLMKQRLDTNVNGYDDVRLGYPTRWQWGEPSTGTIGSIDNYTLMDGKISPQATREKTYYMSFVPIFFKEKRFRKINFPYDNTNGTKDHVITLNYCYYHGSGDKDPETLGMVPIAEFVAKKGTKGVQVITEFLTEPFIPNKVNDRELTFIVSVDTKENILCSTNGDYIINSVWSWNSYKGWYQLGERDENDNVIVKLYLAMSIELESSLMYGTDKYAFGLGLTGRYQIYNYSNEEGNLNELFENGYFLPQTQTSDDTYYIDSYIYSKDRQIYGDGIPKYGAGWQQWLRGGFGGFGHPIRTVRYRELPYDIYDNGTEIIRVDDGKTVPSGYTVVPKGALRGAWFGNPELTRDQLVSAASYVTSRLLSAGSSIDTGGIG